MNEGKSRIGVEAAWRYFGLKMDGDLMVGLNKEAFL